MLTWAPLTTDWKPDPQRRLMVSAGTGMGIPHRSKTCLEMYGASFEELLNTLPIITESTSSGATLADCRAAFAATSCKSTHVLSANFPPKVPNGVRLAPTIKTPRVREAIFL